MCRLTNGSEEPDLAGWDGLANLQRSLPSPVILWSCNSVIFWLVTKLGIFILHFFFFSVKYSLVIAWFSISTCFIVHKFRSPSSQEVIHVKSWYKSIKFKDYFYIYTVIRYQKCDIMLEVTSRTIARCVSWRKKKLL